MHRTYIVNEVRGRVVDASARSSQGQVLRQKVREVWDVRLSPVEDVIASEPPEAGMLPASSGDGMWISNLDEQQAKAYPLGLICTVEVSKQ